MPNSSPCWNLVFIWAHLGLVPVRSTFIEITRPFYLYLTLQIGGNPIFLIIPYLILFSLNSTSNPCLAGTPAHPLYKLGNSIFPSVPKPCMHRENSMLTCHGSLSLPFWQSTQDCPPRGSGFDHVWTQYQLLAGMTSLLT